jgi:formyltetrahydrofolate-dependent phosphoribosylglycinamide formyltransferase
MFIAKSSDQSPVVGEKPMTNRVVVLISGSGTNLQAILDAIGAQTLDAEIALVVSNRKAAYGLVRAEEAGVPTLYFPLKPYGEDRAAYDRDLAERIAAYDPRLVVLAGWMHILSPAFLDRFPNRVINLHPALPGQFPGTHGIERTFEALQNGDISQGGCMVHYVVPEVDAGAVIGTVTLALQPDETLESYEARVHDAEHTLLVESIRRVLNGEG